MAMLVITRGIRGYINILGFPNHVEITQGAFRTWTCPSSSAPAILAFPSSQPGPWRRPMIRIRMAISTGKFYAMRSSNKTIFEKI